MQSTGASPLHGDLSLADLLNVAGIATDDVLLVRHTYSADGLTGPHDATVENVLTYSRAQSIRQSRGPHPPGPRASAGRSARTRCAAPSAPSGSTRASRCATFSGCSA